MNHGRGIRIALLALASLGAAACGGEQGPEVPPGKITVREWDGYLALGRAGDPAQMSSTQRAYLSAIAENLLQEAQASTNERARQFAACFAETTLEKLHNEAVTFIEANYKDDGSPAVSLIALTAYHLCLPPEPEEQPAPPSAPPPSETTPGEAPPQGESTPGQTTP